MPLTRQDGKQFVPNFSSDCGGMFSFATHEHFPKISAFSL